MLQHEIVFNDGTLIEWQESLMLGNGKFGAMVHTSATEMLLDFNHYDIYYAEVSQPKKFLRTPTYAEQVKKIKALTQAERYENNYIFARAPKADDYSPIYDRSEMPKTAQAKLILRSEVKWDSVKLNLDAGKIEVHVKAFDQSLHCDLFVTPDDGLVICGADFGKIFANVMVTSFIAESELIVLGEEPLEQTSAHPLYLASDGCLVEFETAQKLVGAIKSTAAQFSLHFFKLPSAEDISIQLTQNALKWQNFWQSAVELPDKTLETLWYLYNYLLEISSGRGSQYFREACGLSGLWNVKNDTLWGSMWYWDVNIQAAFWGAASSGHPETLRLFSKAYLAHSEDIARYTKKVYGFDGWALDYPHTFYNSIQPWCAQFLVVDYEYSQDLEFLREIMPVLEAQCQFAVKMFFADGVVNVPFDISPEQGPLTENSTITLACLRFLFKKTIELLPVAGKKVPAVFVAFYQNIPDYAQNDARLLDSPHTKVKQWLRHPSVLMPIFPLDDGTVAAEKARNTVDYAFNNCEIGMFGGGWIAAAYAQLGRGDEAVYTLYEKGIDQWMHTNGLPFEESERFMNLCIVTKLPIYLPAMMEPIGEVTRTLNDLLLQSTVGTVQLFPALPKGKVFADNQYAFENVDREFIVAPYENVAFTRLLAKGGHRISARVVAGKLVSLEIVAGVTEDITLSCGVPVAKSFGALPQTLNLKKGEVVAFGQAAAMVEEKLPSAPLVHESLMHRHISLGKDRDTAYVKAMDAFFCPYLLGNNYQYPTSVLKFDFGAEKVGKNYTAAFHRQISFGTPFGLLHTGYRQIAPGQSYHDNERWGFLNGTEKKSFSATGVDDLRADGLSGTQAEVFALDMPAGRYSFLVGIGGMNEATSTMLKLPHYENKIDLAPAEFTTVELPFVHQGGRLELEILPGAGPWCLNFLIVNKERAAL